MILFLSAYPEAGNEREGMIQRVAAVDRLVLDCPRVYVNLSYKRHLRPSGWARGRLAVRRLHALLHRPELERLAGHARTIYVHSLHNAVRAPWLYGRHGHKVITDLHGVVPEESALSGRAGEALAFARLERFVLRRGGEAVAVTRAMAEYFEAKYERELFGRRVRVLPILPTTAAAEPRRESPGRVRFVYAGGLQRWQNLERMLHWMGRHRDKPYDFTLLIPDVASVEARLDALGLRTRVQVRSVPHAQIPAEYARADVGLVFRNDTLINRVALPTKLVEYLQAGVVPFVLQPNIGDFPRYGYAYLTPERFEAGPQLSAAELQTLQNRNERALAVFRADAEAAAVAMRRRLEGLP